MNQNQIQGGGIITFQIKIAGSLVPDDVYITSVAVEKGVNRISNAKITVLDGDAASGTFKNSSSNVFVPGKEISIEAGYDSKNNLIFKGIITGQSLEINHKIGSVLVIECWDAAVKMTVGRKSRTYSNQTDGKILSNIIGSYPELSADVAATDTAYERQVQHYITDWDFVLSRAEVNGLIVTTLNGQISILRPDANTSSALKIIYGENLMEFKADLNSVTQLSKVRASAWDYKTQKVVTGEAFSEHAGPGNLSSRKLSEVIGIIDYHLQTTTPVEKSDLTNWSKAQLVKSDYAKIRGEVQVQGTALVDPGKHVTLEGLGDRFSGDHLVSGVVHNIMDGNWTSVFSIGLSPEWIAEKSDLAAPSAAGVLPGIRGLCSGIVKQIVEDPDVQFRVLVEVPLNDPNTEGIWAGITNFHPGNGAATFVLPELGDEVVLGFINEDPRYPVILGSMYSNSHRISADG